MDEYTPLPSSSGPSSAYFGVAVVVTLISFVAGIAIGFFGRPMIVEDAVVETVVEVEKVVTATPDPASVAVAEVSPPTTASEPTKSSNSSDSEAASNSGSGEPTIMDLVLSDARHIQGDPNAPITIVEFSDFK